VECAIGFFIGHGQNDILPRYEKAIKEFKEKGVSGS